ncbi:Peptidyl-prolyl isomerase cwc27, partial [Massospora cicadina]
GESIYGKPFEDEFHSRLRFNRRGLLGMANSAANDNGSQFFFTLDHAEELQGKHTLFGKIEGATVFNVLKIGEGEVGGPDGDRPLYPVRVLTSRVILNPFDDLIPRPQVVPVPPPEPKATKKVKKNLALLSFAVEEEPFEKGESLKKAKEKKTEAASSTHSATRDEIALLQKEIRDLKRYKPRQEDSDEEPINIGKAFLMNQKHKYLSKAKRPKDATKLGPEETLSKFLAFQNKLQTTPAEAPKPKPQPQTTDAKPCTLHSLVGCESCQAYDLTSQARAKEEAEADTTGWLTHTLEFPQEKVVGGDRIEDYEIIDPRQEAKKKPRQVNIQFQQDSNQRDTLSSIQRFRQAKN